MSDTLNNAAPLLALDARQTPSTIGTSPPVTSSRFKIKGHGEQDSAAREHQVTGRDIAGVAAAFNQGLAFARSERLHHNACLVPSIAAPCICAKREQESLSVGQHLRAVHHAVACRRRRAVPVGRHSAETRMIPSACANTIPSVPQVMPKGLVAGQMVTAAPPVTAICLSAWSAPDQNAMDWPSGEKIGFDTN